MTYYECIRAWSSWGQNRLPHQNYRPPVRGRSHNQWGLNLRTHGKSNTDYCQQFLAFPFLCQFLCNSPPPLFSVIYSVLLLRRSIHSPLHCSKDTHKTADCRRRVFNRNYDRPTKRVETFNLPHACMDCRSVIAASQGGRVREEEKVV